MSGEQEATEAGGDYRQGFIDCTLDELRQRIVWLQDWLRNPHPR